MGNKHRKEVIVLFMKSTNTSKISIVFWVALAICTTFVIYGAILPKQLEQVTQTVTSFIAVQFYGIIFYLSYSYL